MGPEALAKNNQEKNCLFSLIDMETDKYHYYMLYVRTTSIFHCSQSVLEFDSRTLRGRICKIQDLQIKIQNSGQVLKYRLKHKGEVFLQLRRRPYSFVFRRLSALEIQASSKFVLKKAIRDLKIQSANTVRFLNEINYF